MMSDFKNVLVNLTLFVIFLFALRLTFRRTAIRTPGTLPRPPGPRGLPVIGNLHQIPSSCLWERASQWRKEFGDLVYVEALGQQMLFLNSYEDAVELLANRSAKYSSRPHSVIMDLQGWDWVTINVPYGEIFRQHRTHQQRFMNSPETLNYLDAQLMETRKMLEKILNNPWDYGKHVMSLPGAVAMLNIYGHRVEDNDKYVELGRLAVRYAGEAKQFFFLDVLPWLRYLPEWFPFLTFHHVARESRKVAYALRFELYELTKKKIAEGVATESMTSIFLAENTRDDGSVVGEDDFCAAAATLFNGGGVDTTATAIMTFVLAMLKNPGAQRLAQQEVDRVVGFDRLPTIGDEPNLPYVRAVCAEILRFAAITPFAMPHYTTADDVYKGYFVPAGTTVLANVWEMSHDPRLYEDPSSFKPERWVSGSKGDEEHSSSNACHPGNFAFGFGRRTCPGQKWAEQLLFIAVASMLTAFNITKAMGEDGKAIAPNESYLPSFVRTLRPSKCRITPRSEKIAALIKHSVESSS